MVSLMSVSSSCDSDASANGITWHKGDVTPFFSHLGLIMLPALCDAEVSTNDIT